MAESIEGELISLTQRLLDSIARADWSTYTQLCDPSLSCFEPEARGHLVEGLDFHRYYFDLGPISSVQNTISSPHVRVLGDVAIVSYVRLVQRLDEAGHPLTTTCDETRVWQRLADGWRHVHFHRS